MSNARQINGNVSILIESSFRHRRVDSDTVPTIAHGIVSSRSENYCLSHPYPNHLTVKTEIPARPAVIEDVAPHFSGHRCTAVRLISTEE